MSPADPPQAGRRGGPGQGDPACPVCGLPGGQALRCPECRWELRTERRLGPVTEQMRAEFDGRLAAARRAFDAQAAALVSSDPGRLARWIRGGRPAAAEWPAALRHAARVTASAVDEAAALATLAGALEDLASGAEMAVMEVGPAGVGITRMSVNRGGTPLLRPARPLMAWTELIPVLSPHEDERLLQLAGAIAGLDRELLRKCLADVVSLTGGPQVAGELMVLCRPAGWRILDEAAREAFTATARARLVRITGLPDRADGDAVVSDSGMLGRLVARMPLVRGYGVVVATVVPATGEVSLGLSPLFRPGDVRGAESVLTLRRVPGDGSATTLAVAVTGSRGPREAAPGMVPADPTAVSGAGLDVMSLYSVPLPDQLVYRVRAVLDAPGQVRFTEPPGVTRLTRPWPEVLAGIPRRVDIRTGPVDLVCAVELGGGKGAVDRRRDLVKELIEYLAGEYRDGDLLRVGLLGCADHDFQPGEETRRVVRGEPLGSPATALRKLPAKLSGVPSKYPSAAPLEDLLYYAHELLAGSRASGRGARLLLVAGRPAHPVTQGPDLVHPCPKGYDWRVLAGQLGSAGVSVVTVVDKMPRRAVREGFWNRIGDGALRALGETGAREVAADLGVAARPGQRIEIPLAG